MNNTYIDDRIESMLISKIANYRLNIRHEFRNRHKAKWPELKYKTILGDIRDLKVWLRMAELVDESKYRMPIKSLEPYTVYKAKELSK
tara:strand:- start:1300 stop:1563 length:264 start_codon:yes stop_codon:yes gene_type:complete